MNLRGRPVERRVNMTGERERPQLRAIIWPNEGIKPCPKCGEGTAVIRRNKRTGWLFVGCSRFPECRWTRKTDYALDWGFQSNPVPLDPEKCAKVLYGVSLDELRTGPIIKQKQRLRDRVPKEVFHQFMGVEKKINSMEDFILVPICCMSKAPSVMHDSAVDPSEHVVLKTRIESITESLCVTEGILHRLLITGDAQLGSLRLE